MTKKELLKEILGTSIYLLIVLIVTILIVKYVGQMTEVIGDSMETTLHDGDKLIVDKIKYRVGDPERFDVIVFPYKPGSRTCYIKRIIGLPGETVKIDEYGIIYIDDKVLVEKYGREKIKDAGLAANSITVGEDEYFVLGDNRNNSQNSRDPEVGLINRKDILGRAWLKLLPIKEFHLIRHKEY